MYKMIVCNQWKSYKRFYFVRKHSVNSHCSLSSDNPKIIYEPKSQIREVDDLVVLDVTARGKGPLTYQWFKDGQEFTGMF